MMTVRELIQALVMNCDLDDKLTVELKELIPGCDEAWRYKNEKIRRVFHCGDGEAVVECHDD